MLDQQAIVQRLVDTIRGVMFVDTAGVLLWNDRSDSSTLFLGADENGGGSQLQSIPVSPNDPLFALVSDTKSLITKYDLCRGR